MKAPSVIISDKFLTVNFGTKTYMVNECDPKFKTAVELYKDQNWEELHNHLDAKLAFEPIKEYTDNNITIVDGEVLYKGKVINNYVVDKILSFREKGFPYQPIVNFLNNLLESHSWDVVKELYSFLEKAKDMPITEDGAFLAYRKVDEDYMSFHANPDGTHNRNKVGDVVEMLPSDVNPNRNETCSSGLHFCSQSYLPHFWGRSGRVMQVKIFPQHVITIPSDYNDAKGRCFKYEVVGECPDLNALAFGSDLYTSSGSEWREDSPTHEDIVTYVVGAIKLRLDLDDISLDSVLYDIGVDELDRVELIMMFEEQYDIDLDDIDYDDWETVKDVVVCIENALTDRPEEFEEELEEEEIVEKKVKTTLDIDIIRRINNYLDRHDGETITLRKINKSLKVSGFTVQKVKEYLDHMGYTVKVVTPYNQSYISE